MATPAHATALVEHLERRIVAGPDGPDTAPVGGTVVAGMPEPPD